MLNLQKVKADKPVVIVTGCTSGIGLELARLLYKDTSFNTVITARQTSVHLLREEFTEREGFIIRALDITSDDQIYSLIQNISELWGRVDKVINNAAVCYRAVIEHMDYDSEMLQLRTNYLGPMSLIRSVLPIMREQRSGQIINISSVSGMLAMPTMGSYSASKHALEGATEALWYEAKPFGIRVNLVQLGFVNSSSFKKVILSKKAKISSALAGPHSEYYRSMTPMIELLMSLSVSSSSRVARNILKLLKKPSRQLRLPMTPDARIFGLLRKVIPSFVFQRFLYFLLPGTMKWGGRWRAEPALWGKNDEKKRKI